MNGQIIDQIIENITFTSEELAEVGNDDVIENWDSVVEEEMESIEEFNAEMKQCGCQYTELVGSIMWIATHKYNNVYFNI